MNSLLLKIKTILIVNSIGGTNAANLFSRFCYEDTQLLTLAKDNCDYEQKVSPDKVLAEIVHLPEAGVGNILQRPHLRNYEITLSSKVKVQFT